MCERYLGFVLLVWFTGVLRAQSTALHCGAPSLSGGYLVPEQETYSHESELTYACDNGRKPAVEGWWAISTCQNGKWSHEPQCIDKKACILPTIPNAKYTEKLNGWYEEGRKIRITCDEGYEQKDQASPECINGTWNSVPVCERSTQACGEPPKIPHAVIIHQEYQEVFVVDSKVQYECEDGYTVEEADGNKSIFCIAGSWTEGPTCRIRPGTGLGGSTVGGTHGGHTTSTGSGTQPASGGGGIRPGTGLGGSTVGGTHGGHTTSTGSGTQPASGGGGIRPGTGLGGSTVGGTHGGHTTSTGSGTQPASGGGGTGPLTGHVSNCGKPPIVPNGEVVETNQMFLKYRCSAFYKLVGPETVVCYSDGTWSEVPTCRAAYCAVDTDEYPLLKNAGVKYIKDGESLRFECVDLWLVANYSEGRCTDGRMTFTRCCNKFQLNTNIC